MIANDEYIISIGVVISNKCEGFNLKKMKLEEFPDLNSEERQRPILVFYNHYLYIFMGYNKNNILDSIERIQINNLQKSKCEKVAFKNYYNINIKFYGAIIIFIMEI